MDSGPHDHAPAARMVGLANLCVTVDDAAGGEVRSRHELNELIDRDVPVVDVGHRGIDGFRQVVRRDLGGHTDGDTVGTVDQEAGNGRGQYLRFLERSVEVVLEVHRFLGQVPEHFLGKAGHAGFRVSHGGRAVPIDGPEVALSVHHGIAQGEILCHADHRVVDGRIPVRVVLTEYFPDHARALLVGRTGAHALLVHGVEDATVYRLESIPYIGQRSADNHRHGIVDVGGLHFLLDVDRDDAC